MEDIKLAREMSSVTYQRDVAITTLVTVAGQSNNRVKITISSDGTSVVRVGFGEVVPTATVGIPLTVQNPTRTFDIQDYGWSITTPIQIFGAAALTQVTITDCTLARQQ